RSHVDELDTRNPNLLKAAKTAATKVMETINVSKVLEFMDKDTVNKKGRFSFGILVGVDVRRISDDAI
ncbi:1172_t:CDS:2, partial [Dentiscutata erythropus]